MDAAPSLTLTRAELVQLTEFKQPKRMCAWLKARQWVFELPTRRGDVPKVDRAYYLARMSGQQLPAAGAAPRRSKLNLDWMLTPQ